MIVACPCPDSTMPSQWPDPATTKTVLGQTALGGSQIAFNDGFMLAWTGTDSLHHLNVAEFELR
jgi:hypothetical protein